MGSVSKTMNHNIIASSLSFSHFTENSRCCIFLDTFLNVWRLVHRSFQIGQLLCQVSNFPGVFLDVIFYVLKPPIEFFYTFVKLCGVGTTGLATPVGAALITILSILDIECLITHSFTGLMNPQITQWAFHSFIILLCMNFAWNTWIIFLSVRHDSHRPVATEQQCLAITRGEIGRLSS